MKLPAKAIPDLNIFVDSDWAGCPATRRSTTGFVIALLGTPINYGSNAGNNCPLKCRGRAICHQHRRNRSTSHQKPLDGASQWTSTRSTSRSTQAHQVARAWTQELEPQEKQNALNPNIFSFNNWSHTTKWDWSKFTQTTTQHIDQVCLNRDSATTPSTSWTWHPASQPSLKPQENSFTSSLQQASSNTSTYCSVRAPKHTSFTVLSHGINNSWSTFCCNILEYINMISHHVFQHDSRYVLSQHECRLHGEVYVHVPHNMSVIHNMFFLLSSEFNSLKNSTVWFVQTLRVNILLTTVRLNFSCLPQPWRFLNSCDQRDREEQLWVQHDVADQHRREPGSSSQDPSQDFPGKNWSDNKSHQALTCCPHDQFGSTTVPRRDSPTWHGGANRASSSHGWSTDLPTAWHHGFNIAQLPQDDFVKDPNRSCHNSLLSRNSRTRCDWQQGGGRFDLNHGQQRPTIGSTWQQDREPVQQGIHHTPTPSAECGSTWRFKTDEISSTQHWTLMSSNDQAVMAKIGATLSSFNSFLWTYNYVFPTAVVTNSDSDHWQALLHAVEYGGATRLNRLPQQEGQCLWNLITDNMHHHASKQLSLAGAKTTERLRGNDERFATGCTTRSTGKVTWRPSTTTISMSNMEENDIEEQQVEESQL